MHDDIAPSLLARTSPLTAAQKSRLSDAQKFLVNIADADIGGQAARHGYDGDEHRLGWQLWQEAAGVDRPLEHSLSQVEQLIAEASASPEGVLRIRVLDDFENRWLPRARNAIRRFVAHDRREAVLRAFFEDLSQQPQGPAVIASVERFLVRVAELERSDVEGAAEAVASLRKKGLTGELVARIRATIEESKAEAAPRPSDAPTASAIAEATRAQLEAYGRLSDWYIDWSSALRDELGYHASVKLGISASKGGRPRNRPAVEEPAEEELDE